MVGVELIDEIKAAPHDGNGCGKQAIMYTCTTPNIRLASASYEVFTLSACALRSAPPRPAPYRTEALPADHRCAGSSTSGVWGCNLRLRRCSAVPAAATAAAAGRPSSKGEGPCRRSMRRNKDARSVHVRLFLTYTSKTVFVSWLIRVCLG